MMITEIRPRYRRMRFNDRVSEIMTISLNFQCTLEEETGEK